MIRKLTTNLWFLAVITISSAGAILGCGYSAAMVLAALFLPSLRYVADQLYSLYISEHTEGGAA